MKLKYNGIHSVAQFAVNGEALSLARGSSIDITDAQADELQSRPFVKKLVKKGVIEFVGTKSTKPTEKKDEDGEKELNDYNKDELLDIAEELGIKDINARTAKGDIITAIEEARK